MRKIGAVILAAGSSSRFGRPKQLLEFQGETLIRRAFRAAQTAKCDPIVVVVGETVDEICEELGDTSARLIRNDESVRGLGTSIRCGVQEIAQSIKAVILLTCDQPLVDGDVIARLIAARKDTGKPIVASGYVNTLGIPALFDQSRFEALLTLPDAAGAKSLLLSEGSDVASIAFEDGAVDIDTPADFERLNKNTD